MADNGKSSELRSSIISSRYGLISTRHSREARDCGWETGDSGDSLSYSD